MTLKFPASPILHLEDATLDFEYIGSYSMQGDVTGTLDATTISTTGLQKLLQLNVPANVKMQFGVFTTGTLGIGTNTVNINLTAAWPTNHLLFIASAAPSTTSTASDYMQQGNNFTLTQGFVRINSSASQTWVVNWLSLGN